MKAKLPPPPFIGRFVHLISDFVLSTSECERMQTKRHTEKWNIRSIEAADEARLDDSTHGLEWNARIHRRRGGRVTAVVCINDSWILIWFRGCLIIADRPRGTIGPTPELISVYSIYHGSLLSQSHPHPCVFYSVFLSRLMGFAGEQMPFFYFHRFHSIERQLAPGFQWMETCSAKGY